MPKPRSDILTPQQIQAATMLNNGWDKKRVAQALSVSRTSVTRWIGLDHFKTFQGELKQITERAMQGVAKDEARTQAQMFRDDLKRYRHKRQVIVDMQVDTVTSLLEKLQGRVNDLPEESFHPQQIASLLSAITNVSREAFDSWGELLGLRELRMQLDDIQGTLDEAESVANDASGINEAILSVKRD